ncbi:hypothetical protein BJ944DRAFT_262397 [Cunninghamella echinulata]|nr:hypothetical protein BJ944DRAFT_262397 [Cunninghamella echinulata]
MFPINFTPFSIIVTAKRRIKVIMLSISIQYHSHPCHNPYRKDQDNDNHTSRNGHYHGCRKFVQHTHLNYIFHSNWYQRYYNNLH